MSQPHIVVIDGKRYDNRYSQAVFEVGGQEIRLGHQISTMRAVIIAAQITNQLGYPTSVKLELLVNE